MLWWWALVGWLAGWLAGWVLGGLGTRSFSWTEISNIDTSKWYIITQNSCVVKLLWNRFDQNRAKMGNYRWRCDYKKSQDLELEPIAKNIVKKPLQKAGNFDLEERQVSAPSNK